MEELWKQAVNNLMLQEAYFYLQAVATNKSNWTTLRARDMMSTVFDVYSTGLHILSMFCTNWAY